jgi:hypothetical protein
MLPARNYESEHTKFMRAMHEQKPQLAVQQRIGRAIWWDKTPRELAERQAMDEMSVPQKPYVYATD